MKWLGGDRHTGECRDRLRDRVGLLGAHAAVLDRKLGGVPGRVDVLDVKHCPCVSTRRKPFSLSGMPRTLGP